MNLETFERTKHPVKVILADGTTFVATVSEIRPIGISFLILSAKENTPDYPVGKTIFVSIGSDFHFIELTSH